MKGGNEPNRGVSVELLLELVQLEYETLVGSQGHYLRDENAVDRGVSAAHMVQIVPVRVQYEAPAASYTVPAVSCG